MKRKTAVACVFLNVLVAMSALAVQAERPADFGKRWVRQHPLTIMGLSQSTDLFDFAEYKAAGMNALLAWKNPHGHLEKVTDPKFPAYVNFRDAELSDDLKARITALREAAHRPLGILVRDEPQTVAMPGVAKIVDWIRTTYPETLVYSNAYPQGARGSKYYGRDPGKPYAYGNYLSDFASIVKPDILMFDVYPFRGESGVSGAYFPNLENVREEALRAGIPYWLFVQSAPTPGARFPSESELRMQIYSSLAYGFTGIAYFTYDIAFERGLLETDGSPNRLYYAAARANREVHHLGRALRFLTSVDVRHVPGRHEQEGRLADNSSPNGTKRWVAEAGEKWKLRNVEVIDPGQGRNALVGLFTDDDGGRYFMVVNLWSGSGAPADERELTVDITLDPAIQSLARLSRETGAVECMALDNGILRLVLPGGTGDLFQLGDGDFPGL